MWFIIQLGNWWALWSSGSPLRFRDGWPWASLSSCRSESWGTARLGGCVMAGEVWSGPKPVCPCGSGQTQLISWVFYQQVILIMAFFFCSMGNNGAAIFNICSEHSNKAVFLFFSQSSQLSAVLFQLGQKSRLWVTEFGSSVSPVADGQRWLSP